jgi:ubiquinone/menaquinone biosynthesis C-methylase UbiE
MKYTGERMIPDFNRGGRIYREHWTRYLFASRYIFGGMTVLDIACGAGYGSDFMLASGAETVIGVDISEEAVAYCREKYPKKSLQFKVGNVDNIPLRERCIDVAVSFETIEHVEEEEQTKFLKEIKRVLKPDGVFIISTPHAGKLRQGGFHKKELDEKEFRELLGKYFSKAAIYYQNTEKNKNLYFLAVATDQINERHSKYMVREATFIIPEKWIAQ